MKQAQGLRPRTLAGAFGGYVLLVILLALFLSDRLTSGWYEPTMVRWVLAAYLVLGGVVLIGVGAAAVARQGALDLQLETMESAHRMGLSAMVRDAPVAEDPTWNTRESPLATGPSDQDVEQLLVDLDHISSIATAAEIPDEELAARLSSEDFASTDPRTLARDIRRLERARAMLPAYVAGPSVASVALIAVAAALLPSSDGMMVSNLQLNSLMAVVGIGYLLGLAVYAGAAFRSLGRKTA